jgi:hypothetical protein
MVHTRSDLDRVLPNPVLNILGPGRLKLLLADRTWGVAEGGIVRGSDPWLRGFLLGVSLACSSFSGSLGICGTIFVASFARFNPILFVVRAKHMIQDKEASIPFRRHTSYGFEHAGKIRSYVGWS